MKLRLDESYTGEFDELSEDQLFEKALTAAMRAVEQVLDSGLRKAKSHDHRERHEIPAPPQKKGGPQTSAAAGGDGIHTHGYHEDRDGGDGFTTSTSAGEDHLHSIINGVVLAADVGDFGGRQLPTRRGTG